MYVLLGFIVLGCETKNADYYKIESKNKIINLDEIYEAKIFLLRTEEIDTNIQPVFYIINGQDTFYLPYDTKNHCAIYRGVGYKTGTVEWSGTFEYKTKNNRVIKTIFSDKYSVK